MKKALLSLAACAMMVASADAMYIVGDPAGSWSPAKGIEMTEADGGWKWTGNVGSNQWFAFATQLDESGDWNLFNSTYRLNPSENGTVAAFGDFTLELGGADRAFKGCGEAATYIIKEAGGVYTLTVTEPVEDVPEPEKLSWSVVGEFNEWGGQPDFQMTEIRDGVWKATMYDFSGEFKFRANNAWDVNLGFEGEDGTIEADGDYALVQNGRNFSLPEPAEEIIFLLDVNNSVLTVDGLSAPSLMLTGSFNSWSFDSAYSFVEVDDDVYMLELDQLDSAWQFKISDEGWNEFYTTGVSDMTAGEPYPLIDRDGPNMGVDNSYSEVTIILNVDEGYVFFTGEVGDGVAAAEIASGSARYFNLQGVEVQKPSTGLYIRVINGKPEKILVK